MDYESIASTVKSTTNSEGETSVSVEETNRLRKLLGLKPLKSSSDESSAAKNPLPTRQDLEKKRKRDELQGRLDRAKTRRKLNTKLAGATLGDADEDGGEDSALNWVLKMRKKNKQEKMEKKKSGKKKARKKASSSDGRDEGVVLTLKDTLILDEKAGDLAESDLAETVRAMAEEERKKEIRAKPKPVSISLGFSRSEANDYEAAAVATFAKRARKKKKLMKKLAKKYKAKTGAGEGASVSSANGSGALLDRFVDGDDSELQAALANSRKRSKKNDPKASQAAASCVAERVLRSGTKSDEAVDGFRQTNDDKIVFTSTSQFTQSIRLKMMDSMKEKKHSVDSSRAKKAGTAATASTSVAAAAPKKPQMSSAPAFVSQPLVKSGVGAALALLHQTGDLRAHTNEVWRGRARDEKQERTKKGELKLEYRDEAGRLLTKQEAFRQLSYRFHGQKPGKKNLEKRRRQLEEQTKGFL